ncbi:MAG: Mrp/NBP35 family ATP-binding protein [Phycisphaerales bacterium]|nr:Mrp/NBP35 family ATP-binding protein [Phycisphaerales bacterium]
MTNEQLMDALRTVDDPELHRDLVTLGMVKTARIEGGAAAITVEPVTPGRPLKDTIRSDIEKAVRAKADQLGEPAPTVAVEFTANVRTPQDRAKQASPLPDVKHIIAIGAGKGGVGKSTVAVNLAIGLARAGASVGLLDGDIYGPSLPTMLGLDDQTPHSEGDMIRPFESCGIKSMTIGKLVEPDKPLIWRGPMAHGAFQQLATQTKWGELDYLIVDLPPGTGDVPLTLAQTLPLTGAVIVCTPQKVAQDDAVRAAHMFQQLNVDVLGVVENMSYFVGDDGKEYDIFGRGGAEQMAQRLGLPFLGGIPINMALRENCDAGEPLKNFDDPKLRTSIETVVGRLAAQVSMASMSVGMTQPTMSITE